MPFTNRFKLAAQAVVSDYRITIEDHRTLLCEEVAGYDAVTYSDDVLIYQARALVTEACPTCGCNECFCRFDEDAYALYAATASLFPERKAA